MHQPASIAYLFLSILVLLTTLPGQAQDIIKLKSHRFPENKKDDSMWSGIYTARSGKIYIGLCTHADAANFYEFDPATGKMEHLADLTVFKGERGQGIRTSGKIHVSFVEDKDGKIYFGDFCEDNGPECIDPSSYRGAHWFRFDPEERELVNLGRISRHAGLLGMSIDPERRRLYGLAEDGHLYMYDLEKQTTTGLGRVDDWDICRTIAADDKGNIYGAFPVNRVWKYNPETGRIKDLQNISIPNNPQVPPRTMSNPKIDRKALWRILEWQAEEEVFYGITNADSRLFRFDPYAGEEGAITPLALMCADKYLNDDPKKIPIATLAFTLAPPGKAYYAPVTSVSFDYSAESWDVLDEREFTGKVAERNTPPLSVLVEYDISSGKRRQLGRMETEDGRKVYGLGGAVYSPIDNRLYFAGAVEEHDPEYIAGEIEGAWHYAMMLLSYPLPE
ncbi:MAG: hypothetical protein J5I98_30275 [Phaeodactylibacter sp.]|nr:hypothetical protein [Phaeodactylibacter sp.]